MNVHVVQTHRRTLFNMLCSVLHSVGAAEEAAAGRVGTPRGEKEAEALGRTPEQRPWKRLGPWQGKRRRERPVLRRAAKSLTQGRCPRWTAEALPAQSSAHARVL